ncbi:Heat shock factor-binding protein 1 [Heterocephalus glaber]|uniref:Heat shock factor-binding protein 1 n=1 Tax=Heterocephalus glaber TaxID=10181 RepID=G5BWP6_HETGA|nr:Heat shock factor-binding protein 1 [Heterocephalus glaber]
MVGTDPKTMQDLSGAADTLQHKLQTMSNWVTGKLDDMSSRMNHLEKNLTDLRYRLRGKN